MQRQAYILIEAVESETLKGRFHFRAVNTPDYFKQGLNHSRSLRTWATKRGAIAAGIREFRCLVQS